jgi:hypothetical protein
MTDLPFPENPHDAAVAQNDVPQLFNGVITATSFTPHHPPPLYEYAEL